MKVLSETYNKTGNKADPGREARNAKYDKTFGSASKGMSKAELKQRQKVQKEYAEIYAEANNNVAAKLNPKVKEFNEKWAKEFEGYSDWSKSPKWDAYEKAFTDQYYEAMEKEMERLYKKKYGN